MNSLPAPGTGYFVAPPEDPGPGILVLPSAWGLTTGFKQKADELADGGFTVLVPDLNDGDVATSDDEAHELLMAADMNVAASLVQSSLRLLRAATLDSTAPVGVLGYGSGASWALWLSERFADQCCAVTTFCGTQSITFEETTSDYLLHFAEHDDNVSDEELAMMGLNLQLAKRDFHVETHAEVSGGFAEPDHPNFDGEAEAVAWRQTLEFFANRLR